MTLKDGNLTKVRVFPSLPKPPSFTQAQTHLTFSTIAVNLFSMDALQGGQGQVLKTPAHDCIHKITLTYWQSKTKKIEKEKARLDLLCTQLDDGWKKLTEDASKGINKLSQDDFQTWLKLFTSVAAILEHLLGVGETKKKKEKIMPKPLRNALKFLATTYQVQLLKLSLNEELSNSDPRKESEDALSIDNDLKLDHVADVDWCEGIEEYQACMCDELWTQLGHLVEKMVPFFNLKQDPEHCHDPWTDEGEAWLQECSNGDPLSLHWHQLVGVLKMLENTFLKKPILLVGLGKTIQVAAFIAMLSQYFTVPHLFLQEFSHSSGIPEESCGITLDSSELM
ncbi:uncharacterized protein LACBIDRAFT_331939 [Laccaria bicolor S238N-H82]|uniref:Predicted protein n=1 Tax=Laccaria bicolor (strain S238N-H82 / ATCC MYA-4686) TaxID=486041 RepID=B0DR38_LACBS|nr:uncharacterized protein LACBIDRAFT_331939 [Laccaria bicolor S238N-H82]EDR02930.1 predicted protein [Laccaria bicolor S238N-H82]|eukprot:XP_001886353.1 predicted protein [Laccaria bicolor S238N-H82]